MTVMLRIADMDTEQQTAAPVIIKKYVNQNICKILF